MDRLKSVVFYDNASLDKIERIINFIESISQGFPNDGDFTNYFVERWKTEEENKMIHTKQFTLELLSEMKYLGKSITEQGLMRDRPRLYNSMRCYFKSFEDALAQIPPFEPAPYMVSKRDKRTIERIELAIN